MDQCYQLCLSLGHCRQAFQPNDIWISVISCVTLSLGHCMQAFQPDDMWISVISCVCLLDIAGRLFNQMMCGSVLLAVFVSWTLQAGFSPK